MKMKGIDVPAQETATGATTTGEPVGPGSGRKRLYHVLKHGAQDAEGAGKGDGKGAAKSQGNRAGFEGKKKEYLNKQ